MQNFTIQNGRPLLQIMITRRVSSNSAHQESLTGRAGSSGNPRSSATPVGCHSGLRLLRVGFGKVRTCKTAGHRRPGRERFEAFGRGPQLCTAQAGAGNRYPGSGKEVLRCPMACAGCEGDADVLLPDHLARRLASASKRSKVPAHQQVHSVHVGRLRTLTEHVWGVGMSCSTKAQRLFAAWY